MPSWKSPFPVRKASLAAATGLMMGLPSAMPLMAQQQTPSSGQPAVKSEITRQLEALYERDGRPMPQMVIPRYQPQPMPSQSAAPQSEGRVQPTAGTQKKGLLHRLLPSRLFRSRKEQAVPTAPPVEPPSLRYHPSQQPAPMARQPRLLPGTADAPRAMPQQPGAANQTPAVAEQQTANQKTTTAEPVAAPAAKPQPAPAAEPVAETPAAPTSEPLPFFDLSPAPPAEEEEPVAAATTPEPATKPQIVIEEPAENDARPQPAPAATTAAADPFDNLFPEEPEEAADESASPYTGLTLDEDPYTAPEQEPQADMPELAPRLEREPETVAETPARDMPADDVLFAPPIETDEPRTLPSGPALSALPAPSLETPPVDPPVLKTPPAEPARNEWQQSDPVRSKMDRIAARHDATGLKGFCPVMLRDHRELVDASEPFRVSYKGREYLLSSAEAVAAFQANPAAYAPALGGNDVIHYAHTGEYLPGSLDHAVWYKGRLYMFASAETLEAFTAAPSSHATDE